MTRLNESPQPEPRDQTALASIYRAATNMLLANNTRRGTIARFHVSIISALVGLLALVTQPGVESTLQRFVVNLTTLLALILTINWFLTIKTLRKQAEAQRQVIRDLERLLPFDPITRMREITHGMYRQRAGYYEEKLPLALLVLLILMIVGINLL